MGMLSWFRGVRKSAARKSLRTRLGVERLDDRALPSVGLAYVGLSRAPAAEMSYLASQFRPQTGEVEVAFLPFEFNPTNPFGNATRLAQETLPGIKGRLRLTVELEWFVHSNGDRNGKLNDGAPAAIYGRPAQQAFWAAWGAANPTAEQQQIRAAFLGRVRQADAWVAQLRSWAASKGVGSNLGITYIPILEDECQSKTAFTNLVNAIKAQQAADGLSPTLLRRSLSTGGNGGANFRVSGVTMEWHGSWAGVRGNAQPGDTWSNDGTTYGINGTTPGPNNNFVADGHSAAAAGVSVLYWNSDMNGALKTDTNWTSRTIAVFSGAPAAANKARLTLVFEI